MNQLKIGECRNLPLPNSVKKDIQQQFAAGITIEKIINSKFINIHINYSYKVYVIYRLKSL